MFTMQALGVIIPDREESHFLVSMCLFCVVLGGAVIELALNCVMVHDGAGSKLVLLGDMTSTGSCINFPGVYVTQ